MRFFFFHGLRVPISKARYRTIDSLLEDLNSNINMPFGVRRLTTPRGRTSIKNLDELQHMGRWKIFHYLDFSTAFSIIYTLSIKIK